MSHIVEQELQSKSIESDMPCSNLDAAAVLNSIHSQALIHAIAAWRTLKSKIIGRSGQEILQLNQISEVAINSSVALIKELCKVKLASIEDL